MLSGNLSAFTFRQRGFSLIETVIALSILLGGLAVFFWQVRSQNRHEARVQLRQFALELARNDLESLQGLPQRDIHDTEYQTLFAGSSILSLRRQVVDSSDLENTTEDLKLDNQLNPLALREPVEVLVAVYVDSDSKSISQKSSWSQGLPWSGKLDGDTATSPLIRLHVRIPEYHW